MSGPSGVMAAVLAQAAAGTAAVTWLGPLWNETRRGFFRIAGLTVGICAGGAWASIAASPGNRAATAGAVLSAATAGTCAASVVALFARWDGAGRVLGIATVALSAGAVLSLAGATTVSLGSAVFRLAAGSLALGSVLGGLLLGHWYLTDRKLPRTPINRFATLLLIAVGVETVSIVVAGFDPVPADAAFNPILAGTAPWIAIGMTVVTGVIAVLIRLALRGERASAVQAATGFFYLAVVTALVAETATTVRFFPAA